MKNKEMQEHLIDILDEYSMRTDLVNKYIVNPYTFVFLKDDELGENDRWEYYIRVCRELKIKDKVIRSHGMDSDKASSKKVGGHNDESFFEQYGYEVQSGTNKTDLRNNGESFASVKGGVKIQWGMHVVTKLPEKLRLLFGEWISTYENNFVSLEDRKRFANTIINTLSNKNERYYLLNYFLRKNENIPFLIVKDVNEKIYYRIDYKELIDILVDNIEFYTTKDKVKIVATIKTGNKNEIVFEIEPRTDKNNALLMHGQSKVIINIIKNYDLDVKERYQQNAD
jgi:hypothetical protein